MSRYAHPEVLVTTDWVSEHLDDAGVAIVEVDVDTAAYDAGHIPGAIAWDWRTQLCDTLRRDVLSERRIEELLAESGIDNDTTVVLYGDNNNWFAAWAFWQLEMAGHRDVRILDGGRSKWLAEGREVTTERPRPKRRTYRAGKSDARLRALLPEVVSKYRSKAVALVDVRSPDEYTGKLLAPPGLPETCQRGGHIPGAQNIPWGKAVNEDGTFKSADELRELYAESGVTSDKDVIAYCRIGERSSHTWFVLRHLLGYPSVKNYDGSWTEWGNLVGAEIERGE